MLVVLHKHAPSPMCSPTVVACFAAKSIAVSYAMEDPQAQLCGRTCTSVHMTFTETPVCSSRDTHYRTTCSVAPLPTRVTAATSNATARTRVTASASASAWR